MSLPPSMFTGLGRSEFMKHLNKEFPVKVTNLLLRNIKHPERNRSNLRQIKAAKAQMGPPRYVVKYESYRGEIYKLDQTEKCDPNSNWIHFSFRTYFVHKADAIIFKLTLDHEQVYGKDT